MPETRTRGGVMFSPDEAIDRVDLRRQMEQNELGALYATTSLTNRPAPREKAMASGSSSACATSRRAIWFSGARTASIKEFRTTLSRAIAWPTASWCRPPSGLRGCAMAFYRPVTIKDYGELAKGLMRRRLVLLGVFGAVLAVATTAAFQVPRVYKSSAMILIQPGQTSQPGGAGLMNLDQRLRTLRPLITSRTELEAIINELGLYRDLGSRQPVESLVEHARARVEVEVRGRDLFRVSFVHPLPETAQIVTDRLSRKLTDESVGDDIKRSRDKVDFLRGRGDDLKGVLKTWDAKI
ncbi:MAG: hypothetical protein EXR76_13955 [Myxococcales bacterium]|nr:hypothetical protein [Myxococcales bacterium]